MTKTINPLIAWRKAAGLTREDAARALGISYSHLARLENNYHESLSLRVLDALAALGVNGGEFRCLWQIFMAGRQRAAAAAAKAGITSGSEVRASSVHD